MEILGVQFLQAIRKKGLIRYLFKKADVCVCGNGSLRAARLYSVTLVRMKSLVYPNSIVFCLTRV